MCRHSSFVPIRGPFTLEHLREADEWARSVREESVYPFRWEDCWSSGGGFIGHVETRLVIPPGRAPLSPPSAAFVGIVA